jgi:hypothetical protein
MLKKPSRRPRLDLSGAETLAANALSFLAEEPARLVPFCRMSGIEPAELAASAHETLRAVLEHLASDDSLLLVFTSSRGMDPETVHRAIALLGGGGYVQST